MVSRAKDQGWRVGPMGGMERNPDVPQRTPHLLPSPPLCPPLSCPSPRDPGLLKFSQACWEIFLSSNYWGGKCGRLGTMVPLFESEPSLWVAHRPHRAGITPRPRVTPSPSVCPVLSWASPRLKVLPGSFLPNTLPS